jgi:uncharacterized protein (UPF0128 family)
MARLVIALLEDDSDKVQAFHELDMSWTEAFNQQFEKNELPYKPEIYAEEFVDMASYSVLNNLVTTESDEQFKVNRDPIKIILKELFKY